MHIYTVEHSSIGKLNQNQRVSYDMENEKRGRASAVNLDHAD